MENIFSKCMLLVLEQHAAGGERKIRREKLEVKKADGEGDAQDKAWRATKKIFGASSEYIAIGQLDNQVRKQLEALELPAQFQRGTFAIPMGLVEKAQKIVDKYRDERQVLVDTFIESYSEAIENQRKVLGPLFDITDYPPSWDVADRFWVGSKWIALSVPEKLGEINPAVYDAQVKAQEQALHETMEEVRQGLRAALKGLIDHLLNRLSQKDGDGKVKHLRSSAVDNIVEFLDLLPAKNVTGDLELQKLAERARAVVTAVDVDVLKTPGMSRAIFEKQLGDVNKALDGLIESAPLRKFGGFGSANEDAA